MSAVNDTHTGSCEQQFSSCHSTARRIFDMDALNFWKFLSSTLNFRISHQWTGVNWRFLSWKLKLSLQRMKEERIEYVYGQNLNSSIRWLWILLFYGMWLSVVLYKELIVTYRFLKKFVHKKNLLFNFFTVLKIKKKHGWIYENIFHCHNNIQRIFLWQKY